MGKLDVKAPKRLPQEKIPSAIYDFAFPPGCARERFIPSDTTTCAKLITLANLHERYQYVHEIGQGAFGNVFLAMSKFNREELMRRSIDKVGTLLDPLDDAQFNNTGLVAIKTFRYRMKKLKYFKNIKEVDFILNMPSHPCLLQIYEMIIDDYNFELHVCMESMTQNLNILMRNRNYKFTRSTVKCILSQLLSAINHIHIHGYYHRDIKPDNILIIPTCYYYGSNEGIPPHRQNDVLVVKLGDYGLARSIYDTKISTGYVSTRWYRAPEILLYQGFYSQPVDIWAFGVIALELVNHAPLIAGGSHYDQVLKTIQILGSPLPEYFHPHFHRPLGGFWREAANLAEKCQFQFPLCYGSTYTEIIKERYYDEIIPVASVCLLWDPYARASSEALCGMTYFENTFISAYESERKNSLSDTQSNGRNKQLNDSNPTSQNASNEAFSNFEHNDSQAKEEEEILDAFAIQSLSTPSAFQNITGVTTPVQTQSYDKFLAEMQAEDQTRRNMNMNINININNNVVIADEECDKTVQGYTYYPEQNYCQDFLEDSAFPSSEIFPEDQHLVQGDVGIIIQ